MRRLLGVENAIFTLKPVTLKLGLSEETWNQVVACWQSEAKQLEMILLRWREKQENTDDYAVFRKALEGLAPEGKNAFRADYLRPFRLSSYLKNSCFVLSCFVLRALSRVRSTSKQLKHSACGRVLLSVSRCLEPLIKHSNFFLI